MNKLNANKVGLVLGTFVAFCHLVWVLAVAVGLAQPFMDYIFRLHMISPVYKIGPFNFGSAIMLIIITFIVGYIAGWVFAFFWNKLHKTTTSYNS